MEIVFAAKLWQHEGTGGWYFLTLPQDVSADIRDSAGGLASSFGSVRVHAAIGRSRWKTSIFPDRKAGAYLLPVKAAVRTKEQLRAGELVEVLLVLDYQRTLSPN
jgi:hypothetical protein